MSVLGGPDMITDGLIAYYDAANARSYISGSTIWYDSLGNTLISASLTNGPIFDSVNLGNITFDGVNDIVSISATTSQFSFPQNNFTYEVWCRPTATHEIDVGLGGNNLYGGTSGQKYLIGPYFDDVSPFQNPGAGISAGTNGVSVYEHTSNYLPPMLVSSTALSNTIPTHIVVTYTSKQPRLYLNAVLDTTGITSGKTNVRGDFRNIGGHAYGYFQGSIYSVKIYNRALSAAEVLQNYNATRSRFGL